MTDSWAIKSADGLLLEEFTDFVACYDSARGETHILDAFPGAILKLLNLAPRSREEIRNHLAREMGDESDDWVVNMDRVLRDMEWLQLVEMRSP